MTAGPKRPPWHVAVILAFTFVVHHFDRNVLSYSLPLIASDFGWSDRELGMYGQYLLGAFFLTYGIAQMALSGPAERFGAKRSMMLAIIGFSLISFGMGIFGTSVAILIALRLLLGLAECVHVPMMSAITAHTFPDKTRARANAIWNVGLIVATSISPLIIVPLVGMIGWRNTFIVVGSMGLLLALPVVWRFVEPTNPQKPARERSPDLTILRDRAFWMFTCASVLNAIKSFGILGWLPTYFVREKHVDFSALGWPLALIYTSGIIGTLLFAWLGDRLRRRLTIAWAGMLVSSLLIFVAARADGIVALIGWFALSVFAHSTFAAQEMSTIQLIAGHRSIGAVTGYYNGLSVLFGGLLGSMVPGAIISATGNFDAALAAIALAGILAAVLIRLLELMNRSLN